MEGAVLFGIEPSTINTRKAKYTIGKGVYMKWDDKKHLEKGEKIYFPDFQKWFCNNCFEKFIEINQDLKYEESFSKISFISKGHKKITMEFYKTTKENPIFTFEEGITKIGKCIVYIDKEYKSYKERKISVTMKFGGTFIDVTGIHLKTGKTVKTTLTFD